MFSIIPSQFLCLFWSEDTALRHVFNLVIVRGFRAFHSSRIIIANLDETVIRLQSFSWTGLVISSLKYLSANLVNKVVNKQSGCLLQVILPLYWRMQQFTPNTLARKNLTQMMCSQPSSQDWTIPTQIHLQERSVAMRSIFFLI